MKLSTLVYVSAAHVPFTDTQLVELLAHSRKHNSEAGITGLLLYKGGNFLQVLEGDEDAVLELKTRIARDPRHHSLIVLLVRPIEKREFADWSMAFRNLNDPSLAELPGYNELLATDLTQTGIGGRLAPLIESFRRTMR